MSSSNSSGGGNTITPPHSNVIQIAPAKDWCFTLNNYTSENISSIKTNDKIKRYIFQEEVGESGTPHLQGYIEFKDKVRPLSIFSSDRFHWEKRKGTKSEAINYCCKIDTRAGEVFSNFYEEVRTISPNQFYPYQKIINEECATTANDRRVNVIRGEGNDGKTQLCKYLCVHKNALILAGNENDMKFGVTDYISKNGVGPKIIILNIPRGKIHKIDWGGIEQVKDGIFFSPKFKGSMCTYNSPHIYIFTNEEVDTSHLTNDKWKLRYVYMGWLLDDTYD